MLYIQITISSQTNHSILKQTMVHKLVKLNVQIFDSYTNETKLCCNDFVDICIVLLTE